MSPPAVTTGDVYRGRRLVTAEEIRRFGELVGDRAAHHVAPRSGPPVAHGLFVAATAGRLLAELDYVGRDTALTFLVPVRAGEEIEAVVTITRATPAGPLGTSVAADLVVTDTSGAVVLTGTATGLLPDPENPQWMDRRGIG